MIDILFLSANPPDTNRLRIDEEIRGIDQSLRTATLRDHFHFVTHMAVRYDDLQELLLRHQPTIVHFSGHGDYSGELIFQGDNEQPFSIAIDALEALFALFTNTIKCVVLNACYSYEQAAAIAKYVECVIGMSDTIHDNALINFSKAFYRALAYGRTIQDSFDLALSQIGMAERGDVNVPKLISINNKAAILSIFDKLKSIDTLNEISSTSYRALRYLESLKTIIENGFRNDTFIMSNVEKVHPEDRNVLDTFRNVIDRKFGIEIHVDTLQGGQVQTLASAVTNKRLVALLGDPGLGKTTAIRHIALTLIDKILQKGVEEEVFPLWASLGRWSDRQMPAETYLWNEFCSILGGTGIDFNEFISRLMAGKFLVLLDGLNELPQRQLKHKTTDSDFKKEQERLEGSLILDERENSMLVLARDSASQFYITCRVAEYTHLPGWNEFRLLPFDDDQINAYIFRYLGANHELFDSIIDQQSQIKSVVRNPYLLFNLVFLARASWQNIPTDRFKLMEYSCLAALGLVVHRYDLTVDETMKILGRIAHNAMSDGFIGSLFRYLVAPDDDDIQQLRCGEDAGLIVRAEQTSDHIAFRYQHQLVQEALALYYERAVLNADHDSAEANALLEIGKIHHEWGKVDEAFDNYSRALQLCSAAGNDLLRGRIHRQLSICYRQKRSSNSAVNHALAAIHLLHDDNSLEVARAHHEMGNVYMRLRQMKLAEKHFKTAIEVYESLDATEEYAYELLHGLGTFYSNNKVYKQPLAIQLFTRALDIFYELDNKLGIGIAKIRLARAFFDWGVFDESLQSYKESAMLFSELEIYPRYATSLLVQGHIYSRRKQYESAVNMYNQAREIAIDKRLLSSLCASYMWGLGNCASVQGAYHRAVEYFNDGRKYVKQLADPETTMDYEFQLGLVHMQAGKLAEAFSTWNMLATTVDHEYYLNMHMLEKFALRWAKVYMNAVHSKLLFLVLAHVARNIYAVLALRNPDFWINRRIWRLFYWLSRF